MDTARETARHFCPARSIGRRSTFGTGTRSSKKCWRRHAARSSVRRSAKSSGRSRCGRSGSIHCPWKDGYRLARIAEALQTRQDWDVASTQDLQLDVVCLPWREMREVVLAAETVDPNALTALDLLKAWDGRLSANSAAAAVFELFANE